MDENRYREIYEQVKQTTEYDADIYMGEPYEALLLDAGMGTTDTNLNSLLRLQLGEELFLQAAACESENDIFAQEHKYIEQILRGKLCRYTKDEQKAMLIQMIEDGRALSGESLEEQDCLQLRLKSDEELWECLVHLIMSISFLIVKDTAAILTEEDNADLNLDEAAQCTFSPGVCAASAYICDEKLRSSPELLGAVSGSAARIAQSAKKNGKREKVMETVETALLLLAATAVIYTFCPLLITVEAGSIALISDYDAVQKWSELREKLLHALRLLRTELKVGVEIGLGSFAVAVTYLGNMWENRNNENAAAAQYRDEAEAETNVELQQEKF